jgi:hypothetical protein
MDTSVMEYTAEDLIAHKLLRSSILVAKPKFDQQGADLLAFLAVNDGARFCRIQCKGRSLISSSTAQVEVNKEWVTSAFVVFVFVETGQTDETYLYCFTADDIHTIWNASGDRLSLSITAAKLQSELAPYRFSEPKVEQIKAIIRTADVPTEFRQVVSGSLDVTLEPVKLEATGTVSPDPGQR